MRKLVRSRSGKVGAAPGTPVFVGQRRTESVEISVIDYAPETIEEQRVTSLDACLDRVERPTVTWINVDGLHDAKMIASLADRLGLHPLIQEDILNTTQRPKMEIYGDHVFVVLKMIQWDAAREESTSEQVSLVLGPSYVISFQERPGDAFAPVRARLRAGAGRLRARGADYLAYCLIDAIVDEYFVVLEHFGERIEQAEGKLVGDPAPATLQMIYRAKRENLLLRRAAWPLRDMLASMERAESALIDDETRLYLRDAHDHAVQVLDIMETLRDMLAGMLDTYLSSQSNRMNEVMKVLTIIATIFIPLTFIAGIYGMNFAHMPELQWPWAYPAAMSVMGMIAMVMVLYFRRRRWL